MKTIKITLLFICAVFSTLMFLCGLFSTIAIIKTTDFGSGKIIVITISIFLSLLFGLLSMLCYRKMYRLIHPKQTNPLDNIIAPFSPEQTTEECEMTTTKNMPNQIVLSSSTSISHVDSETVISNSDESPTIQYAETSNEIYRTDGKSITDEEVPHLIQIGYEETIKRKHESTNIKFHRTSHEEELSFRFTMNHGDEIEKHTRTFENAYRQAYSENNLDKKIVLLQNVIDLFEKEKKWFYRTKGGTIYFQDYYEHLHNSNNEDFSYIDSVKDYLEYIVHKRDCIIPKILQLATSTNGIMQKDIYSYFPDESKSDIQKIIRELENDNKINRTKKGNTYLLTLNH